MREPSVFPKVIHQIWIGPEPAPTAWLDSWRRLHADYEYILWTEDEIAKRLEDTARLELQMSSSPTWAGKADILRWEILYRFGGIYSDADSVCLESVTDLIEAAEKSGKDLIILRENEKVRGPGCFPEYEDIPRHSPLYSNGFIAAVPGHPLIGAAVQSILGLPSSSLGLLQPWRATGPGLLTRLVVAQSQSSFGKIMILPSYTFLPVHATGIAYLGHGKVYAHQFWGTTHGRYAGGARERVPEHLVIPPAGTRESPGVSLLVCSHNTPAKYLKPCVDSILHQQGRFWIEVVWVDDGSDPIHSQILHRMLSDLERRSRMLAVKLLTNRSNLGVAASLRLGVEACSYRRIARMDSDDIMVLDRLSKQMEWMDAHPESVMVGAQMLMFKDEDPSSQSPTSHPSRIEVRTLAEQPSSFPHGKFWIMNHPTLMFRKSAVLDVGNYDPGFDGIEDHHLQLRVLKKFGTLHNMPDILVLYRLHDKQSSRLENNQASKAERLENLRRDFLISLRDHG